MFSLAPVLMAALGCASQGQPQPPSLQLPGYATQMTAQRVGDQVTLAWTTPATTTDGMRIRGGMTAVVCLDTKAAATVSSAPTAKGSSSQFGRKGGRKPAHTANPPMACAAVQRLPASPGRATTVVALPLNLTTGGAALLGFRIELQNSASRSAGPSDPAYVAGGQAPSAVGPIQVEAQREGALVRWRAVQPPSVHGPGLESTLELKRTLIAAADAPTAPAKTSKPRLPGSTRTPSPDVTLRPEPTSGANPDPGGMLDRTVRDGDTYRYVAQRVQTVTLAGQTLELRGTASPAVTFTFRDVFPPQPPAGLASIPGGGFGASPSIDLSWDAGPETDLVRYNVYRSQDAGAFVRISPETVAAPAFRDLNVEPGHTYAYRVTAVDQHRNESEPSKTVQETLRK